MGGATERWKQKLIWTSVSSVAGMVLAGVVVYYATRPRPALTYSVSEGPAIRVQNQYKRIFVYSVVNTGDVELKSVKATLEMEDGKIEHTTCQASLGLTVKEQRKPNGYEFTADLLNQGEHLNLSVMTAAPGAEVTPKFAGRGPGVCAVLEKPSRGKGHWGLLANGAALLVSSASIVVVLVVWRKLGRLRRPYPGQYSPVPRPQATLPPLATFGFTGIAADRWMEALNLNDREPQPKPFFCHGSAKRGDCITQFSNWDRFFEAIGGWPATTEGEADLQLWTRDHAAETISSGVSLHFQFAGMQRVVELSPTGSLPPDRGKAIVEWAADRLGKIPDVQPVGCDLGTDGTARASASDSSSGGVQAGPEAFGG